MVREIIPKQVDTCFLHLNSKARPTESLQLCTTLSATHTYSRGRLWFQTVRGDLENSLFLEACEGAQSVETHS